MAALTRKQRELLDYIRLHQCEAKESPSFAEMREALGLKSKSGVHRLVTALVERGYLKRLPNRARALEVVADPHLPDYVSTLSIMPTSDLAAEARRRGLSLGKLHRTEGGVKFQEIAA